MAILDPSSFKFEKYVYKRYKKGKLDKYKLVADSKGRNDFAGIFRSAIQKGRFRLHVRQCPRQQGKQVLRNGSGLQEKEGENFVCKDNFDKRKNPAR